MKFGRAMALLAAPALVTSCSGPQDYMHAAGPAAHVLSALGRFALWPFCLAAAAVWLLLAWIALRRKGSLAEHAPPDRGAGLGWIYFGGLLVPGGVLAGVFLAMLGSMRALSTEHAPASPPEIRVIGHQWWFEAEYLSADGTRDVRTTTELHIPTGRSIDVELVSRDVIHSFWIPKLGGKADLIPGQANHTRLQADAPGVYEGQCAEFCGVEHARMRVRVVAESPRDYGQWLERQRQPAVAPGDAASRHGKDTLLASGCPTCHTIRGTDARGSVGPDLTHVASRGRIAGGALPNDTAHLEAWVTHAQSLKPGAQMPDQPQFSGSELRDVVAYLQSLK